MKIFHVQQRFHPVGHGTFMTGQLKDDRNNLFSWVYDCGSKRKKPREDAIDRMETSDLWSDPFDMLVLSHFDDDHVNGLEKLLKLRSIKTLVLPFSEWQQRVREVCIGGKKGISESTAQLQLDPVAWLQSLNLANRVETILLVRGGPGDPDSVLDEPIPLPTAPDRREGDDFPNGDGVDPVLAEFRLGINKTSGLKALEIRHQTPIAVAGIPMEFMFYNAELSGRELETIDTVKGTPVARKSKTPLDKVRLEIETEICTLGLSSSFSLWPPGWRSKLKKCYEKHFGSTNHARNNISLCMTASPVQSAIDIKRCSIFKDQYGVSDHELSDSFDFQRPCVLCTGDLKLSGGVIASMQSHFGAVRWDSIGLTQVPHHGSKHSWTSGNAALLSPTTFVHCAPGTLAHPHKDVVQDLLGQKVFTADYKNCVTLQYHFFKP